MFKIKVPIWKTRSVGLAEAKLKDGINKVEILYTQADGERLYPGIYKITKERALTYPSQIVRNNVKLRIIPINELDV